MPRKSSLSSAIRMVVNRVTPYCRGGDPKGLRGPQFSSRRPAGVNVSALTRRALPGSPRRQPIPSTQPVS
jgi:hypothetical protein